MNNRDFIIKTIEHAIGKENTMKNVLFLAPSYPYVKTTVHNLSKHLDDRSIPFNACVETNNCYIRTNTVNVEFVYADPVRWVPDMFKNRDAVYGNKALVDQAAERFFHMLIKRPPISLQRYLAEAAGKNDESCEEIKPRTTYVPEITKVHFNHHMTIVIWNDGTKTTVKCQEGDVFSKETGLALCIAKKALGNMPNFNNVFKKWIPEEEPVRGGELIFTDLDVDMRKNFIDKIGETIKDMLSKHRRGGTTV